VTTYQTPELVAARRRLGGPVVIGVDPSRSSSSALQWAAAEASRSASPLRLVTALSPSLSLPSLVEQLERRLLAAAQALGVEQGTCLVAEGSPHTVVNDHAQDASLVVVGRRPFGPTEHLLVGHTSLEVAASSPAPVVVVPEMPFQPGPGRLPVTVLIEPWVPQFGASPLDDPARHVLGFAFERASLARVALIVVSVHEDASAHHGSPDAAESAGRRCVGAPADRLADRLAGWRRLWPDVEVVLREDAAPPPESVRIMLAAASRSQLVILGRHSASQRAASRLGSSARQVVRQSSRPVAVVPVGPNDPCPIDPVEV
jgi:nucleotide-binding universal stress UspA family protein